MTATITGPTAGSRAKRLKALTNAVHEGVDRSIMSAASFATIDRYANFLAIQYLFHRDVAALYDDAQMQAVIPGLTTRQRLRLVAADLMDLDIEPPVEDAPVFSSDAAIDLGRAIGWLYVAEGANMGAALLRKEAAKLGLSDSHGARHLAPASEGPAPHWRAFVAALDAVELNEEQERQAAQGAQQAFARVQALVDARRA